MTTYASPVELVSQFAQFGRKLNALSDPTAVLGAVTEMAVAQVDGAEHAGITRAKAGGYDSVGATSELVCQVDSIQYALDSGPCVDAAEDGGVFDVADLRTDPRWPEFGRQAYEATGIVSMLSFRLYLEDDATLDAALNMYSTVPDAFDETSHATALLLATHGALALSGAMAKEKAHNLELALTNSRTIGIAIGVLMALHKITRDEGFDLLRLASQHLHRKLSDVAAEVAETGALPGLTRP